MSDPVEGPIVSVLDVSRGIVSRRLVGRDALVMAWARAKLDLVTANDRYAAARGEDRGPALDAANAALRRVNAALSALRSWDAATEGGGSDG